jgi:hypothetical protein
MNHNSRLRSDTAQELPKIAQPQRNAASGRREARPRDVDKDGAAPTGDAGPGVVVKLDKDIVEPVMAPKPVAWFIGRPQDRTVVIPVGWVFAPCIGGADAADRQQCPHMGKAVGPPPQPYRAEPTVRGATVAFALIRPDTGSAKRNGHTHGTGAEPAL